MKHSAWYSRLAKIAARWSGRPGTFGIATLADSGVAGQRTAVRLQRHVAARDQHRHDDHHVPDGVPDPEHPEPRHAGDAGQARRADPRDAGRAQRAARSSRSSREKQLDRFRERYEKLAERRVWPSNRARSIPIRRRRDRALSSRRCRPVVRARARPRRAAHRRTSAPASTARTCRVG